MRENPVNSPIVPPIADNMSTPLAALSFTILSNVVASKYILTNRRFNSNSESKKIEQLFVFYNISIITFVVFIHPEYFFIGLILIYSGRVIFFKNICWFIFNKAC